MKPVTVSSRFQIVIPKAVRERMGIRAGDRFQLLGIGDQITLVPVRPMREMRGLLRGLGPTFVRDEDDRV